MITFKYIREVYENEKKHRNLQKLDDNFIDKVKEYLKRKERLIEKSSKTVLDYSIITEVENFKSLLKSLLELREKKILLLALNHINSPSVKFDENILLDFEKELWRAADKLRGNIDVSEYKHIVLGLLFLKYVSDSFYPGHILYFALKSTA